MQLIQNSSDLARAIATARSLGKKVGFVPTMGALHQGHISLVNKAQESCGFVVVSAFVNPLQFGEGEDFDAYPRTISVDARLLTDQGADVLFAPSVNDVYPKGLEIKKLVAGPIGQEFEGAIRPGHFDGMLTVVSRLLDMVTPDQVFFGEKDAQQVALVAKLLREQIVAGEREPIKLSVGETVRDQDGLALSSRNRRLSKDQLVIAKTIYPALMAGAQAGPKAEEIIAAAKATLSPEAKLEYLELVDPQSFMPVTGTLEAPTRLIIAVRVGEIRLIDNLLIDRT
jgi:pantoate--beta-alanine ligase